MSRHLFAYGTLQPGLSPPEIAPVVAQLALVGPGWSAGTLYDLGSYPGAVFDPASTRRVYGMVYMLPDDGSSLPRLDGYEGPEFERIEQGVTLETSGLVSCWVYHFTGNPGQDRIIESGRWSLRRRS